MKFHDAVGWIAIAALGLSFIIRPSYVAAILLIPLVAAKAHQALNHTDVWRLSPDRGG